jgi:hypothetical protein
MKQVALFLAVIGLLTACTTAPPTGIRESQEYQSSEPLMTQSLFDDKASTISEENIQKILDGKYKLPQQLRVAIVRIDPATRRYYWADEQYLKTQQSYLDLFSEKLKQSGRVTKLSVIPDLLLAKAPTFTNLREAAVRMQADVIVVYTISSDLYSKYKVFSRPDLKAFATTQLAIIDVRTGLIPFSTIVTKDFMSQKGKEELDHAEAAARVQNEAALLTIQEIGRQITEFLQAK